MSRRGFDRILWQHQLFSHQLQQLKTIYTFSQKQVLDATQIIIGELEEK
jgi:hypothetical protein